MIEPASRLAFDFKHKLTSLLYRYASNQIERAL